MPFSPCILLVALHFICCFTSISYIYEIFLSQKRQGQSNSKSRSEKFNPHPEEVASGFPIDPPRPSQAVESSMDPHVHQHKRASHSGPLAQRSAWTKAGRNLDDAPKVSTGADLSTMSGLVAARRSLLSEDRRERSGPSQPEVPKLMSRFPGSFKEASESLVQDQKHHSQGVASSHQKDDGRSSNNDPALVSSSGVCLSLSLSVCVCFLLSFCHLNPWEITSLDNFLAAKFSMFVKQVLLHIIIVKQYIEIKLV